MPFCNSRIAVFGRPKFVRMDERGDWQADFQTDLRTKRCENLQFQGAGAHKWLLRRHNGQARGIHNSSVADDRFPCEQTSTEVRNCVDTLLSSCGHLLYRPAFGCDPADLYGWRGDDEDLALALQTPISRQFAQQWKLRILAQETGPKEMATGRLRRFSAYTRSFNCTEVTVGDSAWSYKSANREKHAAAARPGGEPGN